jgi:hypothetical protein
MSKLAGILLIVLGVLTILVGINDLNQSKFLTPYAAWSSIALGLIIALAGFGHFRAPHKSFLLSVPVLITFIIQAYSLGLFYDVRNLSLFVAGHAIAALIILVISYMGYKRSKVQIVGS